MKNIKDLTGFDKFHKGIHQRGVCQFGQMKDFILSDRQEVLKLVLDNLPEERGTVNYNNALEAIANNDKDYGYSKAIFEIKQIINNLK